MRERINNLSGSVYKHQAEGNLVYPHPLENNSFTGGVDGSMFTRKALSTAIADDMQDMHKHFFLGNIICAAARR